MAKSLKNSKVMKVVLVLLFIVVLFFLFVSPTSKEGYTYSKLGSDLVKFGAKYDGKSLRKRWTLLK